MTIAKKSYCDYNEYGIVLWAYWFENVLGKEEEMRKLKEKIVAVVMLFVITVSVIQVGGIEAIQASQKSEALSAYKEFLKENAWDDGEMGTAHGNYFAIKDLNGDKIPELIVNTGNNKDRKCYYLFTYKDEQVQEIYESWVIEKYYYTEKYFITTYNYSHDKQETSYAYVYKMNEEGNGFKIVAGYFLEKENGKITYSDGDLNDKDASYSKAKAKCTKLMKNKKKLSTPYAINQKNIDKYVK